MPTNNSKYQVLLFDLLVLAVSTSKKKIGQKSLSLDDAQQC